MKRNIIILIILINLINYSASYAQIKSIYDFKYNKFNIGFKISVDPGIETKIFVCSEDSLTNKILFDSTLSEMQDLIFIFQTVLDREKIFYPNNKVYPIPIDKTGIYYINIICSQKFVLTK